MPVPVVNPDPSTEATFTPDNVSEGEAVLEWDSSPNGDPPIRIAPPAIFRTMPPVRILGQDGQPVADAPSPEETKLMSGRETRGVEYAWSTCSPRLR